MKEKKDILLKFSSRNCIRCGQTSVNDKIGLCHACMMGCKNG